MFDAGKKRVLQVICNIYRGGGQGQVLFCPFKPVNIVFFLFSIFVETLAGNVFQAPAKVRAALQILLPGLILALQPVKLVGKAV
jgi:hypothetical protein